MSDSFAPKIESMTSIPVPNLGSGDQGLATLFKSAGDVLSAGVGITDTLIKSDINQKAQEIFAEVNKPYTDTENLPLEIKSGQKRLETLQAAYAQGKLSESGYYAQIVASMKTMKAKYGGYSDEIDTIYQNVTGTRPASALRSSLMAEIEGQRNSAEKQRVDKTNFLQSPNTQEALMGRFPDALSNPEKYIDDPQKWAELSNHVVAYNGKKGELDMVLQQASVDETSWKVNQRKVEANSAEYINVRISQDIAGLNKTIGNQYGKYGTTIYDIIRKGNEMSPEDLSNLTITLKAKRDQLYSNLQLQIIEGSNGFYKPSDLKTQMDSQFQSYDNLLEMITNKEFGVAGMNARISETILDNQYIELLKSSPQIVVYNNLERKFPKLFENMMVTPDGAKFQKELMDPIVAALSATSLQKTTQGSPLNKQIDEIAVSKDISSEQKSAIIQTQVDKTELILSDPAVAISDWKPVFDSVYSGNQDIFMHLGSKSQLDVFKQLTNPSITKRILESGDKEAIQKYTKWALTQPKFLKDFQAMAQDIKTIENTRDFTQAFVNKDGKIEVFVDEAALAVYQKKTGGAGTNMGRYVKNTTDYINSFNSTIDNIINISKASGMEPTQVTQDFLNSQSVDLNARSEGWLQWIAETTRTPKGSPLEPVIRDGFTNIIDFAKNFNLTEQLDTPGYGTSRPMVAAIGKALDIGEASGDYEALLGFSNRQGKAFGDVKITEMSINDLNSFANGTYADYSRKQLGYKATPMGRYQIVGKTLEHLKEKLNLTGDEKFTQSLQDKMFMTLLDEAGFKAYKSGKINKAVFIDRLDNVWEGFRTNAKARSELNKVL